MPNGRLVLLAHLLCVLGLFAYSVDLRAPYFGDSTDAPGAVNPHVPGEEHGPTGSTVTFLQNWHEESARALKFGMFEHPRSVESTTPEERMPYVAHPPGALLPIYGLALVLDWAPSHALVMGFNLALHLAIALVLGWTAGAVLRRRERLPVVTACYMLIPSAIYLLAPGLLYWHQSTYFADQAVLLPVALVAFLDVLRGQVRWRWRRWVDAALAVTLFAGLFTDWLMAFVGAALWVKRIYTLRRPLRRSDIVQESLLIGMPLTLAVGLFVGQLVSLGQVDLLIERLLNRSGLGDAEPSYLRELWRTFVPGKLMQATWPLATLLAALPVLGFLYRRSGLPANLRPVMRSVFGLAWLLLAPCFLWLLVFSEHAQSHQFSAQKFWLPVALLSFSLVPYVLLEALPRGLRRRLVLLPLVPIVGALAFLYTTHPTYQEWFESSHPVFEITQTGPGEVANDEVVFSPDTQILGDPPAALAESTRPIYEAATPFDVRAWLAEARTRGIEPTVVVLFERPVPESWQPLAEQYGLARHEQFTWTRIPRSVVAEAFGLPRPSFAQASGHATD